MYVKIDRSFVSRLGKATNDEIVVSGMMSLVRALGMEAIAQGVETAEQAARLREIGCKVVQGYYYLETSATASDVGARKKPSSTPNKLPLKRQQSILSIILLRGREAAMCESY